jgi:hypothetical protein
MRYEASIALNDRPLAMLEGFKPGDPLIQIGHRLVAVEADSEPDALNAVWVVGNRMGADADGRQWPSGVRSLSVGDIIVVGPVGQRRTRYAVATIGFGELPRV